MDLVVPGEEHPLSDYTDLVAYIYIGLFFASLHHNDSHTFHILITTLCAVNGYIAAVKILMMCSRWDHKSLNLLEYFQEFVGFATFFLSLQNINQTHEYSYNIKCYHQYVKTQYAHC